MASASEDVAGAEIQQVLAILLDFILRNCQARQLIEIFSTGVASIQQSRARATEASTISVVTTGGERAG
jgi:hypothetical protein